mmetsp:Transcript_63584/g.94372  ORF Transcript_63584/g.94372 Transcript_63584/m.94372 type:complete len:127 (+) Transcript_63584:174-554(+)
MTPSMTKGGKYVDVSASFSGVDATGANIDRSKLREMRRKRGQRREIFSSMILNNGSEWSDYVVHDEVFFPKLDETFQSQHDLRHEVTNLDSRWLVGFLHHAKYTDDAQVSPKELVIYADVAQDIVD